MTEGRIGRVLVASLHQAIADLLPERLEFYENWLDARGLRRGTIGLAAVSAVLSFLRGEGVIYEAVVARAGDYAADWTLAGRRGPRRAIVGVLPQAVRARMAFRLARRVIQATYPHSRAIIKIRRGVARVDLRGSLFCEVREAGDRVLCGFYLALITRILEAYAVPFGGTIDTCRGVGSRSCSFAIRFGSTVEAGGMARAAAIAVTAVALFAGQVAAQPATNAERLLVVPFENVDREPALYWLTEGAAILLVDAINDQGANAITRSERLRAFEELHLPTANVLSRATVIKVGQLVGASRVIVGTIQRITKALEGQAATISPSDELVVRVRGVRLDSGRLEPEMVERARLSELFDLFQRVSGRVLGRPATVRSPDRAPLGAFEDYVKGLLAENSEVRVKYLESALKRFPGFDRAQLALWEVRSERGEYAQALAAARAVPETSPLSRRARFCASLSLIDLKRHDDAFEALKVIEREQSGASLLNNLGVVQIRRGWTSQTGKPAYYFDRAIAADKNDPDTYFNLGYAYALDNDPQASIYWLRETLRRNPADAEAHYVLGTVLHSTGSQVEAARELDLARHLSARFEELAKQAANGRRVPPGLERLRRHLEPFQSSVEAALGTPAQRDQREMAAFHLDRARRLVEQHRDREAVAELKRAVYLSPYNAEAHLLLGRVYLRTGRLTDAVGALKISIWSQDIPQARIALGEAYLQSGDAAAAREQAERALALAPDSAEAKALLARAR